MHSNLTLKIISVFLLLSLFMTTTALAEVIETSIESLHPYANNIGAAENDVEHIWDIENSEATQMRIHFEKFELGTGDYLEILDANNKQLYKYRKNDDVSGIWTDWFDGNFLRIRFRTDGENTAYGFKIDKYETRTNLYPESDHPESYHPYANNFEYTWEISNSGATQMRIHFEQCKLGTGDYIKILDANNKQLKTYSKSSALDDLWTDWFAGDLLKIELETDNKYTDYGFKVDEVETRLDMSLESEYAESYHPYANNFEETWDFSNSSAAQMRIHFEKFELGTGDHLIILDKSNKQLASFDNSDDLEKTWTEWYAGNYLRVKFKTDSQGTDYGFIIDDVDPKPEPKSTTVSKTGTSSTISKPATLKATPENATPDPETTESLNVTTVPSSTPSVPIENTGSKEIEVKTETQTNPDQKDISIWVVISRVALVVGIVASLFTIFRRNS